MCASTRPSNCYTIQGSLAHAHLYLSLEEAGGLRCSLCQKHSYFLCQHLCSCLYISSIAFYSVARRCCCRFVFWSFRFVFSVLSDIGDNDIANYQFIGTFRHADGLAIMYLDINVSCDDMWDLTPLESAPAATLLGALNSMLEIHIIWIHFYLKI